MSGRSLSFFACLLALFVLPLFADEAPPMKREPIGEVLGKTIYRDELGSSVSGSSIKEIGSKENSRLRQLFLSPLLKKYQEEHKSEVEPTERELKLVTGHLIKTDFVDEELKEIETEALEKLEKVLADPESSEEEKSHAQEMKSLIGQLIDTGPMEQQMAQVYYGHWKLQKHLYDHYGEGRILFQQFGLEAFDAMHRFIQEQEKQGHFKVNDPELRDALYAYWTNQEGSYALTDDREQIRKTFLRPFFLPKELWPKLDPARALKPKPSK